MEKEVQSFENITTFKAYIPLRRKNTRFGPLRWAVPPTREFCLGIPTCWYLKMLKLALPPVQTSNTSRWNIRGVGSLGVGSNIGHVHFMLFVSLSLALGSQREHNFQWNMGSYINMYRVYKT